MTLLLLLQLLAGPEAAMGSIAKGAELKEARRGSFYKYGAPGPT